MSSDMIEALREMLEQQAGADAKLRELHTRYRDLRWSLERLGPVEPTHGILQEHLARMTNCGFTQFK